MLTHSILRCEIEKICAHMLRTNFMGLAVTSDSSPLRTFGIDRVAGCQEILVKTFRVIGMDGKSTTFAPRASAPCDVVCEYTMIIIISHTCDYAIRI